MPTKKIKVEAMCMKQNRMSPIFSQVLRLRVRDGTEMTRVTEVYADDGTQLRGSSSAVLYKGRLLIGTAIHKLLLCDLSDHMKTSPRNN